MLAQTRAKKDYRDGLTEEGAGMFRPDRKVSLEERVAAVAKLEEAADRFSLWAERKLGQELDSVYIGELV